MHEGSDARFGPKVWQLFLKKKKKSYVRTAITQQFKIYKKKSRLFPLQQQYLSRNRWKKKEGKIFGRDENGFHYVGSNAFYVKLRCVIYCTDLNSVAAILDF